MSEEQLKKQLLDELINILIRHKNPDVSLWLRFEAIKQHFGEAIDTYNRDRLLIQKENDYEN